MSETDHEAPAEAFHGAADDAPGGDHHDPSSADGRTVEDAKRALAWLGLGVATLVGLLALYGFYAHTRATIELLVPAEYVSPFLAGFNLALVLLAGAAALEIVRRLGALEDGD